MSAFTRLNGHDCICGLLIEKVRFAVGLHVMCFERLQKGVKRTRCHCAGVNYFIKTVARAGLQREFCFSLKLPRNTLCFCAFSLHHRSLSNDEP